MSAQQAGEHLLPAVQEQQRRQDGNESRKGDGDRQRNTFLKVTHSMSKDCEQNVRSVEERRERRTGKMRAMQRTK